MRHLCIGIAFFLPIAVSILNSLSIIWLARRVNRDLYPPKAGGTLSDFQKGIKDFARW